MSATFVPPALDNTMGAALLGLVISTALYGVSCLQTWGYYRHYSTDRSPMKLLVAVLWLLDSLHTVFITHAVYFYLVTNFGQYPALAQAVWSIIAPVGLNCLSAFLVQMFLAWRVYKLSNKNVLLVLVIALLSFAQLGLGLAMTGIGFRLRFFAGLNGYKGVVTSSLGSAALADILIAISLSFYLYRKRTGFARTDNTINTLIIYSVNSGLLTGLFATAGLISFLAMPDNLVNFAINFVLGKIYSNTLLSTLNARESMRENFGGASMPLELSATRVTGMKIPGVVNISTNTMTHVTTDDDYTKMAIKQTGTSISYA